MFQIKATADGFSNNEAAARLEIAVGNVPIESVEASAPPPYSLGFESQRPFEQPK